MAKDVDHILSLLGEIDFIKTALNGFDKSLRIAFASKEVMSEVGPPGNFAALRKLEKIQAEVLLLNVDLLHIAEKVTSETEDFQVEPEPEPEPKPKPSAEVKKNTQNPVVNNVLDYLNQRLQDDNE
tara:strand:+ start:1752 stop:2129 length:378 start_codon:yes stop_codon:yes gene_type:complete